MMACDDQRTHADTYKYIHNIYIYTLM